MAWTTSPTEPPYIDAAAIAHQFVNQAVATMLEQRAIENEEARKDEEEFRRLGLAPQRGSASRSGWQTRRANRTAGTVGVRTLQRRKKAAARAEGEPMEETAGED